MQACKDFYHKIIKKIKMVNNMEEHSLKKDDWDLTRKELRSQLTQCKLQMAFLISGIEHAEFEIAEFK